ncbi:MAG: nitrilase-related carbon-nitrogen hydrolase [Phenylobacterium sp.]|nr:nitrilase-related carbon-nitrogen hydrolase [Phenylobacterium sp.]
MKVALIQTRTPATHAAAIAHTLPLVEAAIAQGARFILTPEGTNILQKDRETLLPQLTTLDADPVVGALREVARAKGVWIDVGSALLRRDGVRRDGGRAEEGGAANRQILIDPEGAVAATYDKLHMFDVDLPNGETARESATYAPGDRAVTADVDGTRFGLTICYDLRFAALYRALALAGAEVMTIPAAFTRPTGEAHWEVLMRARAIETGSYVLAAAQGGFHEDRRGTWGRSLVVGPWGEVVARLDHDEPGVLLADLDLAAPGKARAAIPALINARPFTGP